MDLDDDELWFTKYKRNYVSKDKIREKIKELNKDIENFCNEGCDTRHFKYIKNFLEELLKE